MSRPSKFPSSSDFKNWISQQETPSMEMKAEEQENEMVGKQVVAKSSLRKLFERIELNDDESSPEELIGDFTKNGGTITAVDGRNYLIETSTGTFYLPRFCVKLDD